MLHAFRGAEIASSGFAHIVAIQSDGVPDDVQRTPFCLMIDTDQVFPQNSDADQLHPAKEEHGENQRREAASVLAGVKQKMDEVENQIFLMLSF